MAKPVMFVGPTMVNSKCKDAIANLFDIHPPVKRGDIPNLLSSTSPPSHIVIVDGIFKASPAVGHKEILSALKVGVQVDGLSSMGAIRAFELRNHAMKGFGEVHGMLSVDDEVTDDEITLVHLPVKPYSHLSIPLVNVRAALKRLEVSDVTRREIIQKLKGYYFGDRTLRLIQDTLAHYEDLSQTQTDALLKEITEYDQKTRDLDDYVQLCIAGRL